MEREEVTVSINVEDAAHAGAIVRWLEKGREQGELKFEFTSNIIYSQSGFLKWEEEGQ